MNGLSERRHARTSGRWFLLRPIAWFGAALLMLLFIQLGSEVGEGEATWLDAAVLHAAQAMRALRPWLAAVMRDLTGVGSTAVLALLATSACGYLVLIRARRTAAFVALSVASAAAAVELLKALFGRERPAPEFAAYAASGLSFPSGHTSMSTVVFMTLGLLVARTHGRAAERFFIVAFAAVLALLVGVSRAALGVHWATDVIGGWVFGTSWAIAWLLAADTIDMRRSDSSLGECAQ